MVRYGYWKVIWVVFIAEANVAASLSNDAIPNAFQGSDDLAS